MFEAHAQRVAGNVIRVINRSDDTGRAVLEINDAGTRCTLVGSLADADEGLRIEAEGDWADHPRFGRQFRARSARLRLLRHRRAPAITP